MGGISFDEVLRYLFIVQKCCCVNRHRCKILLQAEKVAGMQKNRRDLGGSLRRIATFRH